VIYLGNPDLHSLVASLFEPYSLGLLSVGLIGLIVLRNKRG